MANMLSVVSADKFSCVKFNFRVVGGLLSAYDLSGDTMFLEKAKDIGDRLLPAWDTPSGIPYNRINLALGNAHNQGWTGVMYQLHSSLTCSICMKMHIYTRSSLFWSFACRPTMRRCFNDAMLLGT